MPSLFDLPQSQRNKLADQTSAAAEQMNADERGELISTLSAALETDVKAKAAEEKTKTVLAKIQPPMPIDLTAATIRFCWQTGA